MSRDLIKNEQELREKILSPLLAKLGFRAHEIEMEKSFRIKLGHRELDSKSLPSSMSGRADYLVRRNSPETNLFVLEAKRPGESIDDPTQAISYARAVIDGNIPPFAVITNGHDTEIYDVNLKSKVNDIAKHAAVTNGFHISLEVGAELEALESLITLCPENLLLFCQHQVEFRIKPLKGIGVQSDKKYIPELYIDRRRERKRLDELLFNAGNDPRLVLVTGPAQHGKTCFLCNYVERLIDKGIPCLFYPAFGLTGGLLSSIAEDFCWEAHQDFSPQDLISRLNRMLRRRGLGSQLVLFIDGWNEIDHSLAFSLDQDCSRIGSNSKLSIVLSATNNSLERLLFQHDNPGYVSESTNITSKDVRILLQKSLKNVAEKSLVQIGRFSVEEKRLAEAIYSKAYNVDLSAIRYSFLQNPLYLRLAAGKYANKNAPTNVDPPALLEEFILRRGKRAGFRSYRELIKSLASVAEIQSQTEGPCNFMSLDLDDGIITQLIESSILAQVTDQYGTPAVEFYYSRDRDYLIAYIINQWHKTLRSRSSAELRHLFGDFLITEESKAALQWFLSLPENADILMEIFEKVPMGTSTELRQIIRSSIWNQDFVREKHNRWLDSFLESELGKNSDELIEIAESTGEPSEEAILLHKYIEGQNIDLEKSTPLQKQYLAKLVEIDSIDGTRPWAIEESISNDLLNRKGGIPLFFEFLIFPVARVRKNSFSILCVKLEVLLIRELSRLRRENPMEFENHSEEYLQGLSERLSTLVEGLYGLWGCSGLFDSDPETVISEYIEILPALTLWIKLFPDSNEATRIIQILEDFDETTRKSLRTNPDLFMQFQENQQFLELGIEPYHKVGFHPFQLYIPLNEKYVELNKIILEKWGAMNS